MYSLEKFITFYGEDYGRQQWAYAAVATGMPAHALGSRVSPIAGSAEDRTILIVATEHSAAPESDHSQAILAQETLCVVESSPASLDIFTVEETATLRSTHFHMHGTHQEMGQILDSVRRGEAREKSDVLVRDIPDFTPWRSVSLTTNSGVKS